MDKTVPEKKKSFVLVPQLGVQNSSFRPSAIMLHLPPLNIRARISGQKAAFKEATQSKENFHKYIQTKDSENNGHWSWINEGDQ
jgi:hypothetical protein